MPFVHEPQRDEREAATPATGAIDSAARQITVRLDQPLRDAVAELERAMIEYALQACRGRVVRAAQMLGLSRKGLFLKRRRLGLTRGRSDSS